MGALRQMKDSLLHSKLDYQGQINAIAKVQGVIECSLDGEVTNANDIFLNVLGYSLEDVKGKNYSMFVDAQDSAANQGLWQALQRGESRQGEFRVVASRQAARSGSRACSIRSSTPPASRSRSSPI